MAIPKQFESHYIIRTSNGTHLFLISPLAYPSHVVGSKRWSCILRKAIPRLSLYGLDSFLIPFIHRTEFGFRLLPILLDSTTAMRTVGVDDLHYSLKFDTKIHLTSATTTASAPLPYLKRNMEVAVFLPVKSWYNYISWPTQGPTYCQVV